MEDRPLGHGRYHHPAVEPPADDGAVADPRPTPLSPAGAVALILAVPAFALLTWQLPLLADRHGLADPVLRAGLGRHPADRAGPARPGRDRRRDRHERLRLVAPRERRRPGDRLRSGVGHRQRGHPRIRLGRRRADPPSLAGADPAADRSGHRGRPPGGCTGLDHRHGDRPRGVRRPDGQRLARDGQRLGQRRLELERPPRPRRDRLEHRGRQLPARGPLLRGRPADLPLVRRLPGGDHIERRAASTSSRPTSRPAPSSPASSAS